MKKTPAQQIEELVKTADYFVPKNYDAYGVFMAYKNGEMHRFVRYNDKWKKYHSSTYKWIKKMEDIDVIITQKTM